jgi:hypothetical protein
MAETAFSWELRDTSVTADEPHALGFGKTRSLLYHDRFDNSMQVLKILEMTGVQLTEAEEEPWSNAL